MINLTDANNYFKMHNDVEVWDKLDDEDKQHSLTMAERYINSAFELRTGVKEQPVYLHAICEQAIHQLTFDKERFKLQREGVSSYKFDDISFNMENSFISPIATVFLKKHSFKRVGEIL